jgi:tetratricopeptide (TPR) repeat protein
MGIVSPAQPPNQPRLRKVQELKRLLDNGRFYHRQGRLTEAADIYRQVRRADPKNAMAHHLLGLVSHQQGKRDEALQALAEAVRLEPDNAAYRTGLAELLILENDFEAVRIQLEAAQSQEPRTAVLLVRQAVMWGQIGDPAIAIRTAEEAVAADSNHPPAHQVLGMLLREHGDLTRGVDHLLAARKGTPAAPDPQTTCALALFAVGRHDEIASLPPPADERNLYREAVLSALAAWQQGDLAQIEAALGNCDRIAQARGGRTQDVYAGYHGQMSRLLESRKRAPDLYKQKTESDVAVIGDMQSLSAANLTVKLGEEPVRLRTAFVPGCVAVNLFKRAANSCRAGFEAALDRQPEGGRVIASVGDMDCRYTIGFMDLLRRHPEMEGRNLVSETVQRYADWVVDAANQRKLDLILMGPPARAVDLNLVAPAAVKQFLELVEFFNSELRAAAGRAGLIYVDLYDATVGPHRRGREDCFIDSTHVEPAAVAAAIQAAGF